MKPNIPYALYRAMVTRADTWIDLQRGRNGWASYVAKDAPDYVQAVTNEMRSAVECYDGERIVAYMSQDMARVRSWHGDDLGPAKVIKSWPMPFSWQSSRQYQVECHVNGVVYSGRTMGGSMIYRGKRKRGTNSMVPGYRSEG